ncbi:MAG: exosome complex protein Rrp42 [Nanoarchaeota archaeon]|nr:exosome complex protein Rrp42 [Nanoarchaeota archaeon]MBU1004904.1 exosome complex protein Rrp42 [Nanoarchaeota archaeon]MBU1946554.1 exosome complex protein Rrp42 [Nanoarchaeota archaeon]
MNEDLREHIITLLNSDKRLDGRKPLEYRKPLNIEYGFTKTADGSAKVILGETEVLVGIKMEIGEPYPDRQDEGTIIVGAELIPLSNPNFESGPPGIQAVELARVVDRGIRESSTLDFKKLCIKKGEDIWRVAIDIVTLNDAGNLFDASALGAYAALQNTVFPKFEDGKIIRKEKTTKKLPLKNVPVSVTVCKIGSKFIVDPTSEEEKVIDARLTVASIEDGTLCALQKGGEYALTEEEIAQMLEIGIEKGNELRGALKNG